MLSAVIPSIHSYPAARLAPRQVHQRYVQPGPLALGSTPLKFRRPRQIGTKLSHDVLTRAHITLQLANRHTFGTCSTHKMLRAHIDVPSYSHHLTLWNTNPFSTVLPFYQYLCPIS